MRKLIYIIAMLVLIAIAGIGCGNQADKRDYEAEIGALQAQVELMENARPFYDEAELIAWVDKNATEIVALDELNHFVNGLAIQKMAANDGYLVSYTTFEWVIPETQYPTEDYIPVAFTMDEGRYKIRNSGEWVIIVKMLGKIYDVNDYEIIYKKETIQGTVEE